MLPWRRCGPLPPVFHRLEWIVCLTMLRLLIIPLPLQSPLLLFFLPLTSVMRAAAWFCSPCRFDLHCRRMLCRKLGPLRTPSRSCRQQRRSAPSRYLRMCLCLRKHLSRPPLSKYVHSLRVCCLRVWFLRPTCDSPSGSSPQKPAAVKPAMPVAKPSFKAKKRALKVSCCRMVDSTVA